jgi:hypothetical protein
MHREDLLSRDLLSEIVLLGFGALMLVSLLLVFNGGAHPLSASQLFLREDSCRKPFKSVRFWSRNRH